MLDPIKTDDLGRQHVAAHFESQGYATATIEVEATGQIYVTARKGSTKYVIFTRTAAFKGLAPAAPPSLDLALAEKRDLVMRASTMGAAAMVAAARISADEDKEGALLQPVKFMRV